MITHMMYYVGEILHIQHTYLKQALDQSTLTLKPSALKVALMEFCLKSINLRVSSREQHSNNLWSECIKIS